MQAVCWVHPSHTPEVLTIDALLACLTWPMFGALYDQSQDDDGAETRVVQLLGLDHFELAKELLRNKLKIVWVTKLKQAQNEEEVRPMR